MKISPMGLNRERELIFAPIEKSELEESIVKYVNSKKEDYVGKGTRSIAFETPRALLRARGPNPNDPKASGWTFLINKRSSKRNEIIEAMQPLAEFRGMQNPTKPLEFDKDISGEKWNEWIQDNYDMLSMQGGKPRYVMIIGGPHDIPYHFQAELDISANVGRADFDSIDDLKEYVKKIIRIESSHSPFTNGDATFFATNEGETDPTYFSHNFMVNPLRDFVKEEINRGVVEIADTNATKEKLLLNLKESKSSLVYTASHGMGDPKTNQKEQKRITGGICCQPEIGKYDLDDWLLTADDIPEDTPFLEGSIFFQFACLGFGSPKMSDLNHWFPNGWGFEQQIAHDDFTAAIPKKLLANPHGPVAYIGHLDNALLHGFENPQNPGIAKFNARLEPFYKSVKMILESHTVSEAMNSMNEKYSKQATTIMRLNNQLQIGHIEDQDYAIQLSDAFLTGVDARNFLVMGDPACFVGLN